MAITLIRVIDVSKCTEFKISSRKSPVKSQNSHKIEVYL